MKELIYRPEDSIKQKTDVFLAIMEHCDGSIAAATRKMGVSTSLPYLWMRQYPPFKEAIEEYRRMVINLAEEKLIEKIKAGDVSCIQFALKYMKGSGYSEHISIEHTLNTAFVIEGVDSEDDVQEVIDISKMNFDDIDE